MCVGTQKCARNEKDEQTGGQQSPTAHVRRRPRKQRKMDSIAEFEAHRTARPIHFSRQLSGKLMTFVFSAASLRRNAVRDNQCERV